MWKKILEWLLKAHKKRKEVKIIMNGENMKVISVTVECDGNKVEEFFVSKKQYDELKSQYENTDKMLKSIENILNKKLGEKDNALNKSIIDLSVVNAKLETTKEDKQKIESALNDAIDKLQNTKSELKNKEDLLSKKEEELASTKEEIDGINKEKNDLIQKNKELEQELKLDLFEKFQKMPEEYKSNFCKEDLSPYKFLILVTKDQVLEFLYEQIKKMLKNNEDPKAYIDFFEAVFSLQKNINAKLERLEKPSGKINSNEQIDINGGMGEIKEVLFIGYKLGTKTVSSLVKTQEDKTW